MAIVVAVAAVTTAVVVVARVTDGRGPGRSQPLPVTTVSTTVDPDAATKSAVIAAYRSSFDQFVAVASDPAGRPEDPRLAEHTVGNALAARQAFVFRLRKVGQKFTGAVELHPRVRELSAATATVADCNIDRTATVEVATGKVVSPPATEGSEVTAKLRLDASGVWKQYDFTDEKRPCVPPAS